MGPLLYGTGVNVTVFSYRDHIDFGFMVCREVVARPVAPGRRRPARARGAAQAAAEAEL